MSFDAKTYRAAWSKANPEKERAAQARYRSKNAAKCRARTKAWRAANPEKYLAGKRRARLRLAFDITPEQYDALLAEQHGVCAICKHPERHQRAKCFTLSVDHCHSTGRIRGLLCNRCNRAIGLLGDDWALCSSASRYLLR